LEQVAGRSWQLGDCQKKSRTMRPASNTPHRASCHQLSFTWTPSIGWPPCPTQRREDTSSCDDRGAMRRCNGTLEKQVRTVENSN
jgi:hypothetical protein